MRNKLVFFAVSAMICVLSLATFASSSSFMSDVLSSIKQSPVSRIFSNPEVKPIKKKPAKPRTFDADTISSVPDEIVYFILFNHLVGLKAQVDSQQSLGGSSFNYIESYKKQTSMTSSQTQFLFQTSQDCLNEIQPIDAQAKQIIDDTRSGSPDGELNSFDEMPDAPVALDQLQQQRDAVILKYRDILKNSYGENKFTEFDQFVRSKIAPQVENLSGQNPAEKGGDQ